MVAASTPPRAPTGRTALAATVAAVLCAALLSAGAGTPRAGRPGALSALAALQVSLEQVVLWDSPMNPSLCATQVWHVFGYKHRERKRALARAATLTLTIPMTRLTYSIF
jgi:hypothetical protein